MQVHLLLVAVLAAVVVATSGCDETRSPPSAPLAAPSALATAEAPLLPAPSSARLLLGGLEVGDVVEGWKVESLTLSNDPKMKDAIAIEFAQHDTKFSVWVTPKGRADALAPFQTRSYDLFFGPGEIQITAIRPAIDRLLERIKANEPDAPENKRH